MDLCLVRRSCATQLFHVLDYFTNHLDKGETVDIIYLDFQKAFDSVPHQCLIQKLTSYGVHGKVLQCIKDFLWNRTQQVVLNGQISGSIPVTSGVPQGSVLGTLLFVMFVNDIPSIVSNPTFMLADDIKIFRFVKSSEMNGQFFGSWKSNMHFGPSHSHGPKCVCVCLAWSMKMC